MVEKSIVPLNGHEYSRFVVHWLALEVNTSIRQKKEPRPLARSRRRVSELYAFCASFAGPEVVRVEPKPSKKTRKSRASFWRLGAYMDMVASGVCMFFSE
jgi:hypothetical protein